MTAQTARFLTLVLTAMTFSGMQAQAGDCVQERTLLRGEVTFRMLGSWDLTQVEVSGDSVVAGRHQVDLPLRGQATQVKNDYGTEIEKPGDPLQAVLWVQLNTSLSTLATFVEQGGGEAEIELTTSFQDGGTPAHTGDQLQDSKLRSTPPKLARAELLSDGADWFLRIHVPVDWNAFGRFIPQFRGNRTDEEAQSLSDRGIQGDAGLLDFWRLRAFRQQDPDATLPFDVLLEQKPGGKGWEVSKRTIRVCEETRGPIELGPQGSGIYYCGTLYRPTTREVTDSTLVDLPNTLSLIEGEKDGPWKPSEICALEADLPYGGRRTLCMQSRVTDVVKNTIACP